MARSRVGPVRSRVHGREDLPLRERHADARREQLRLRDERCGVGCGAGCQLGCRAGCQLRCGRRCGERRGHVRGRDAGPLVQLHSFILLAEPGLRSLVGRQHLQEDLRRRQRLHVGPRALALHRVPGGRPRLLDPLQSGGRHDVSQREVVQLLRRSGARDAPRLHRMPSAGHERSALLAVRSGERHALRCERGLLVLDRRDQHGGDRRAAVRPTVPHRARRRLRGCDGHDLQGQPGVRPMRSDLRCLHLLTTIACT